jgi:Lar family restriction alleviation protein
MSELKPCPFCGGENIHVDEYEHEAGKRWRGRVVCLDCMAMVDSGWSQQKHLAIEMWNRRTN